MTLTSIRYAICRFLSLCLLGIGCLLSLGPVQAVADTRIQPLDLNPAAERQQIESALYYHIDPTAGVQLQDDGSDVLSDALALPETAWTAIPGGAYFGYDNQAYWYRLQLHNPSDEPLRRLLEITYPMLDHVEFYVLADGKLQQSWVTGDTHPFAQRPVEHRHFVFPLKFAPAQTLSLYLRVKTQGSQQVPMLLWQEQAFHLASESDMAAHAAYYGMLLVMVLFNFFLYLSLRESGHLYYVLFMGGLLAGIMGLNGVAFQYFFPASPGTHEWLILLSVPWTMFFIGLFVIDFLGLSQNSRGWLRLFATMAALCVVAFIGAFFLNYGQSTRFSVALSLPISLAALLVGISLWIQGNKSARYFTIAWVALLLGISVTALNKWGLLPNHFLTENGIPIGSALEAVLLSFALADRFNRQREALFAAQQEAMLALQQQQEMEDKMLHAASHHPLSGLPNRVLFEREINQRLQSTRPDEANLVLVLLHLRRFDDVNKTLGHQNADDLIRQVAFRVNQLAADLSAILPVEAAARSVVAHIEGVTFACALQVGRGGEALLQIEQLVKGMQAPVEFLGLSVDLGLVVGCAFAPANGRDVQTLLRHAFIAFDQADQEASGLAVYQQEMNPYSPRRLTLMTELRRALEQDELALYFQPQVHLASRRIIGFEALLRWHHAELGFVPPDEFIPMAEKTGLIKPLTRWVIARALAFCKQLEAVGSEATVAVNISAVNLRERGFCEQVVELLSDAGVSAPRLSLEVTETAAMLDPKRALSVLRALHATGVRLSIDDFGTGHSSLSYIRKLPVHEIKIDRSFVMEMHKNRDDATIVRTTVNMCHDLGYELVAEGVENEEIITLLRSLGCDMAQGYHIARPMDADNALAWLAQTSWISAKNVG